MKKLHSCPFSSCIRIFDHVHGMLGYKHMSGLGFLGLIRLKILVQQVAFPCVPAAHQKQEQHAMHVPSLLFGMCLFLRCVELCNLSLKRYRVFAGYDWMDRGWGLDSCALIESRSKPPPLVF